MSSSRVHINRSEYNNLQNQAARTSRAQQETERIRREAAQRERRISEQYEANLESINSRLTNIQDSHDEEIDALNEDFRNRILEQGNQYRQDLANQRRQQQRELQDLESRMQQSLERLDLNIQNIDDRVDSITRDFNNRFDSIVRRIESTEEKEREYARISIEEIDRLLASIRELQPDRFAPGELASLEEQLMIARNDFENRQYAAALAITQVRLTDAGRLLSRLTILNQLFEDRLREVRLRASEIESRLASFDNNHLEFTVNNQDYSLEYDINHWTHGRFNENVRSEFSNLNNQLNNIYNSNINLEGLEEIMSRLNNIDENITACDRVAREELIRSFVVEDMAHQLHQTLTDQGWRHDTSGHNEDDEREPFQMVYRDGTGNQVALVINTGENPNDATIHMEAYTTDNDEANRSLIKDGLGSQLRASGINIDHIIQNQNDCADNPDVETFLANSARDSSAINRARNERRWS